MNAQVPTNSPALVIGAVEPGQAAEVVEFAMRARAELFPMLDARTLPADLRDFDSVYGPGSGGHFLVARQAGTLVAAIGYRPYDQRFPQFDYGGRRVVEIVRLFVHPDVRRGGLASALYQALHAHALSQGVEVLYLHTHPFLPGAIGFWQRQGFCIIDEDDDPVWRTTHMQRLPGL